jgi:hypothetical protein
MKLVVALRTGAVMCAFIAAFMFSRLSMSTPSFKQELEISQKYISDSGPERQYRLLNELPFPQRGSSYDTAVSRDFYEAAQAGDKIRSPLPGYLQLVRDGRVVGRYVSDEVVFPYAFSVGALLPLVSFWKPAAVPVRRILFLIVGMLEVLVVGMFLYGTFLSCC